MQNRVTGIVLSGGASRRMGQDKGLTLYRNKELIQYSIELLTPFCSKIIISSNATENYNKFGKPVIPDVIAGLGPIGGIYSALVSSETSDNLILSCDMPELTSEVPETILSLSSYYDIVVPVHENGFFEPMAGYYSTSVLPVLKKSIENKNYKLVDLFTKVSFGTIDINKLLSGSDQFRNVNRPDDLI